MKAFQPLRFPLKVAEVFHHPLGLDEVLSASILPSSGFAPFPSHQFCFQPLTNQNEIKLHIFIALNFVPNAQILRHSNKPKVRRLVQIHCSCRRLKKADTANTIIMLDICK